MSECDKNWDTSIFKQALKVKSKFRGENSADMPSRFLNPDTPGRSDFLMWANMPHITYSANPETLYDLNKLRQLMSDDKCFAENIARSQENVGITYSPLFYAGLAVGGLSILYSLIRG